MTDWNRLFRKGIAAILVIAAACHDAPSGPSGPSPALTALPRALTAAEQQVLGAANGFSFALWNRLNSVRTDSNLFISPLSASFALGMTLNGAANKTFDEMRTALQAGGVSQHDINAGFRSLMALLGSLDPAVTTQVANSIWYRNDFAFTPSFFDTTAAYFGADVAPLDFSNAPAALSAINGWVSTRTNGRIPTILDKIESNEVMFLMNAIYFKADWREKFDPAFTVDAAFTSAAGAREPVRLMRKQAEMSYAESPTWQAVDLPYGNSAYTMTVVLPKADSDIDAVAASFTAGTWQSLATSLAAEHLDLSLPRLTLSYERTLNDDLKALGMHDAFVGDVADFTRMSPAGNHLYISDVKQKTFVAIDETGTEAAAATSVGIGTTAAPVLTVMRVDHPYFFVIRERLSGTILFMGKIVRMPAT